MILNFFQWMNDTAFAKALSVSVWQFAVIQAFHLVFLGLFAGAVLMVDLRLMGRALKDRPAADVARGAQPWFILGFLGLVATGVPQMMQNAMREYYSPLFWVKMAFLALALIFSVTLRRSVALAGEDRAGVFKTRAVGLVSAFLWLMVAAPARLIGLFS
jgi:hypothetical protein